MQRAAISLKKNASSLLRSHLLPIAPPIRVGLWRPSLLHAGIPISLVSCQFPQLLCVFAAATPCPHPSVLRLFELPPQCSLSLECENLGEGKCCRERRAFWRESPGSSSSGTHYVAQAILRLQSSKVHLPRAGSTGLSHHNQAVLVL